MSKIHYGGPRNGVNVGMGMGGPPVAVEMLAAKLLLIALSRTVSNEDLRLNSAIANIWFSM